MTARFFLSIPGSIPVKDPYDEVFSLFTTETTDAPWAHNRTVSQQSSRLELELDFTPAPSPAVSLGRGQSQPSSRPSSRSGFNLPPVAVGHNDDSSSGDNNNATELVEGLEGLYRDSSHSPSPSPLSPSSSSPMLSPILTGPKSTASKSRSPAARALLGSRKSSSSRTGSLSRSGSGSGAGMTMATTTTSVSNLSINSSHTSTKKPVVIHQSLSTLSQPGQTGTVVWDSSILMSKFLLSIRGLTMGCYQEQQRVQRAQEVRRRRIRRQQKEQIRKLEAQAERLAVSADGALEEVEGRLDNEENDDEENDDEENDDEENDGDDDKDVKKSLADIGVRGLGIQDHGSDIHGFDTDPADANQSDSGSDSDSSEDSEDSFYSSENDNEEGLDEEDMLVFDPAETSVLELGSGCGLLGIVMAELCKDLLLTDQKPVLPLLVKNLRQNLDKRHFDQDQSSTGSATGSNGSSTIANAAMRRKKDRAGDLAVSAKSVKPSHIQIQELVWGQDLDQDLKRGLGVDYVVATDVVYNESIIPKLIHTLKELCEIRERVRQEHKQGYGESLDRLQEALSTSVLSTADGELGDEAMLKQRRRRMRRMLNRTVVLIAQELRTDYVHLAFLEKLEEAGFGIVRMPRAMMEVEYQSGYVIYACFLKKQRRMQEE
ncbi:hypothetical protein BGZ99_005286 [Dissophora globulifera]|uniref:Uncharacterized protein n=1 Tax=Dissophora globulifera TaxID=979702 RepID=A0A9P6RJS0_9FUNG|nr:hypothetical protein BGZ99_005286 [Dissophora globulifera]